MGHYIHVDRLYNYKSYGFNSSITISLKANTNTWRYLYRAALLEAKDESIVKKDKIFVVTLNSYLKNLQQG